MMESEARKLRSRWGMPLVLVLVAGLAMAFLSACGGSSNSSSSSSSSSAGTEAESELSGEPVKVMSVTPMTASGGSSIVAPEVGNMAEAAADWVNANGGINGRPLEVIVCDEKGEPNQDVACARQAVSEGVVAMVGYYSIFAEKAYPVLEPASIANLGNIPIGALDGTSPISFPLNGGSAFLVSLGQLAAEDPQCKKGTGIVQAAGPAVELVKAGIFGSLAAGGGKPGFEIELPPAAQDYSSQAKEIAESGDCAAFVITAGQMQAFIPALRAVSDTPIFAFTQGLPPSVIEELGSQVEGAVVPQYYPLHDSPEMSEFREVVTDYSDLDESEAGTYFAVNSYQSVRVFAEVASKVKDLTAESFLAQLNKSNNIPGFGISPNLDLTAANEWKGVPFQARIFNRNLVYAKVEGGKLVNIDSGEFHDMTKLGEAAFAPPKEG